MRERAYPQGRFYQLDDGWPCDAPAVTDASRPARYRDVFGVAEFRALYAAFVTSMLGDVIAAVSLTVLVFERTGSPALAAATFSLAFIPYLAGGALLSGLVERLPARRVLVTCDLVSAAIVAVMAVPAVPIPLLFVLLFVLSLIAPLFAGVRAATLPEVLPAAAPFVLGRSVLRLSSQVVQVAGNAVGGLLLLAVSPHGALALDAATFLVSAALLRFGTRDRPPRRTGTPESGSLLRDSLGGLRRLLARPALRRLFLFGWLLPACTIAPEGLAAPYTHSIGRSAAAVGIFLAGNPAGTALADLLAARVLRLPTQLRIVTPAALLACVPLLLFAPSPGLWVAVVLLFVSGLGSAYAPGFDQQLVAAAHEDEGRGHALALYTAGLLGLQGVGVLVWGLIAEIVAPAYVIPIAAGCGLLVVALLRPRQPASA
jgi:MFS family permease